MAAQPYSAAWYLEDPARYEQYGVTAEELSILPPGVRFDLGSEETPERIHRLSGLAGGDAGGMTQEGLLSAASSQLTRNADGQVMGGNQTPEQYITAVLNSRDEFGWDDLLSIGVIGAFAAPPLMASYGMFGAGAGAAGAGGGGGAMAVPGEIALTSGGLEAAGTGITAGGIANGASIVSGLTAAEQAAVTAAVTGVGAPETIAAGTGIMSRLGITPGQAAMLGLGVAGATGAFDEEDDGGGSGGFEDILADTTLNADQRADEMFEHYKNVVMPFETEYYASARRLLPQWEGTASEMYNEAMKGPQTTQRMTEATADVMQGFNSAEGQVKRDMTRLGISPDSGRFVDAVAKMGFQKGKAIGGARTNAARTAETDRFSRLATAMGFQSPGAGNVTNPAATSTALSGQALSGANAGANIPEEQGFGDFLGQGFGMALPRYMMNW